jgi:3-oxoacyl-[acyl-carrier-protein] synthase III
VVSYPLMDLKPAAHILSIAHYLPERVMTNRDLEKIVETSDEWIYSRTGIRERRIAGQEETTLTLGLKAAKKLFEGGASKEEVGLVIFATMTPDYLSPATASLIQEELGLPKAGAYDMQVACSGFIYALIQAKAFVEAGIYKTVLVVAADKMSSVIDFKDRRTCILFGDGASAALVGSKREGFEIGPIVLGSDGKQCHLIEIPAGGSRCPATPETIERGDHYMKMEGAEVFKNAVRRMGQTVEELLHKKGLSVEEIAWFVPHQANKRIIDAMAKHYGIPLERFFVNLERYGNTSGASVGIALSELLEQKKIDKGEKVILAAFGAGLAWAGALLERVS